MQPKTLPKLKTLARTYVSLTMPALILAPLLKVFKQRVQLALRVTLQVPIDSDVPPVPNLLREVHCVQDVLGLEEGVAPVLCEEAEVKGKVEV